MSSIYFESIPSGVRTGNVALHKLDPGATAVSGSSAVSATTQELSAISDQELRRGLQSICSTVVSAMSEISPDSWAVELNIGFKASAKVPILMAGEANASMKITLNWRKGESKS
jgi:hypothetical protein